MLVKCKVCREQVERDFAVPCPGRDGNYCQECFDMFDTDEQLDTLEENAQLVARVERLKARIKQHHMDNGVARGAKHASEPAIGAIQEGAVFFGATQRIDLRRR